MAKNEGREKSGRKPLQDLRNRMNGGRSSSRFLKSKNEDCGGKIQKKVEKEDDSLDRLLLVQSDLSSLIQQIDGLVVQAFKAQTTSKQGRKEIESFTHVLSEMISTLKPWVPRFENINSSPPMESENQVVPCMPSKPVSAIDKDETDVADSPEQGELESLISPSPLVSWRGDCNIEKGRQLFVLTPLPISKGLSSRHHESSKSVFERVAANNPIVMPSHFNISRDTNDDLFEGVALKPTPRETCNYVVTEMQSTLDPATVSTPMFSKRDHHYLVMTPCLKMSPPKSCVLLEPITESYNKGNERIRKSTPFPVGMQKCSESQFSDSSSNETSEDLALKYPELLGIQQANKMGIRKKAVESPEWLMSPPKSCVLMEPPDEKPLNNIATASDLPANVLRPQINLSLLGKFCNQEHIPGSLGLVENTPIWKEPESTIRTGKRPGENTLKKELWTKFEAATTKGFKFEAATTKGFKFEAATTKGFRPKASSVIDETSQKGFLDLLEEVSKEETSSLMEFR